MPGNSEKPRREFIKLIQKLGARHSIWSVFDDFLITAAISFANTSDINHTVYGEKVWKEREDRYLRIMEKYTLEERQMLARMLACLVLELEAQTAEGKLRDVLGEVFHELELHNKWKGQFFTPQSISDMMGIYLATNSEESIRKSIAAYGFVSINEPCCGGGAMLYGFANQFRAMGFNYCRELLVVAQDLDERCVMMTYLQCALYGLPAIVVRMNTLSLEQYGPPWYTPMYITGMWDYKVRNEIRRSHEGKDY